MSKNKKSLDEIQAERAARLNKAIQDSGKTYPELEKLTGIPKSSIQRYATGETTKIPIERLQTLAPFLNVDEDYLVFGADEQKNTPTEEERAFFEKICSLGLDKAKLDRIYDFARFTSTEDIIKK